MSRAGAGDGACRRRDVFRRRKKNGRPRGLASGGGGDSDSTCREEATRQTLQFDGRIVRPGMWSAGQPFGGAKHPRSRHHRRGSVDLGVFGTLTLPAATRRARARTMVFQAIPSETLQ